MKLIVKIRMLIISNAKQTLQQQRGVKVSFGFFRLELLDNLRDLILASDVGRLIVIDLQALAPKYIQHRLTYHGAKHARTNQHAIDQRHRVEVLLTQVVPDENAVHP